MRLLPKSNAILKGTQISGAIFSPCRKYRYALWRQWDAGRPDCAFIGLNPSTADEIVLDPTLRRCKGYAQDWGYGGIVMLNLFAYRATDPKDMKAQLDPVGPENDDYIWAITDAIHMVVCAWGAHGSYQQRDESVIVTIQADMHALALTKDGHPRHPLYLKKDLRPRKWYVRDRLLGSDLFDKYGGAA